MSQIKDSASSDVGTITVSVTFFADLRRFLPRGADGPQPYRLRGNATLGDLLATIGIKPDAEVTLAVDGELAERDTPLHDGADVMLLSPMEGGSNDEKGPSPALAPSTPRSTYREYASRVVFGRRLAAGPFSSFDPMTTTVSRSSRR
jgi:sulfur carrier protein ThiS